MRIVTAFAMLLLLGLAETASAQGMYCFQIAGFGNRYRLNITPMGNRGSDFLITGAESVFEDRTVTGTATVGVRTPGTYRMGLTVQSVTASTPNLVMNVQLNAATVSGPFTAWADAAGIRTTGTLNLVSCTGVPDAPADGLADFFDLFRQP
ncbi:MAG: hypothetical protein AB7Q16_02345 [Vicinamibacterales bacterium]